MTGTRMLQLLTLAVRWLPLIFLAAVVLLFGSLSERFLAADNLVAILVQASWLLVAALGVNFVLLTSGVDLSVGAIMYLVVVGLSLLMPELPASSWPVAALAAGAAAGALNGALVVRLRIPAFIATLALAFVFRGCGLYLSGTQMVFASPHVAAFGRENLLGLAGPLVIALVATACCWALMRGTLLGMYVRAAGADREGAMRAGIPVGVTLVAAYALSGALAGLAGFLSFSQTSAATAAFGVNAEFLAIAAAVLGGTSLFGGRGSVWAPVAGAILITTVQNGLVMIDANPYAYPVVTGGVIFLAALFDSLRNSLLVRLDRRSILAPAVP